MMKETKSQLIRRIVDTDGSLSYARLQLDEAKNHLGKTEAALLKSEQNAAVLQERLNDKTNQVMHAQNRLEDLRRMLVRECHFLPRLDGTRQPDLRYRGCGTPLRGPNRCVAGNLCPVCVNRPTRDEDVAPPSLDPRAAAVGPPR